MVKVVDEYDFDDGESTDSSIDIDQTQNGESRTVVQALLVYISSEAHINYNTSGAIWVSDIVNIPDS